jgi:hypothetical protein
MSDTCKHCGKPLEQHWNGNDGAFCDVHDLPGDYVLFGPNVSERQFEAAQQEQPPCLN